MYEYTTTKKSNCETDYVIRLYHLLMGLTWQRMEPTCVSTTEERCLIDEDLLLLLCPRAEKKRVEGTVSELFRLGREPVGGRVFVRDTRICLGGKMMLGDLLQEAL